MRVLRKVCLTMGSLACVALSALPARAADATAAPGSGEIAAGYSYVYDSSSSTGIPAGWFLSGGANLGETFAIVGDISGNYKSQSVSSGGATATASMNVHTFMAGPRVVGQFRQIAFYGQFLAGAARASGGATLNLGGSSVSSSASDTEFCFAPGAGIDIPFSDTGAIRAGMNERMIHSNGNLSREFQLQLGFVYRFGK